MNATSRRDAARSRSIRLVVALAVVLAALALLAAPAPVAACSCIMPDPPPGAFAQADAVFQGRVTSVVDRDVLTGFLDRLRQLAGLPVAYPVNSRLVTIAVSESWKGVTTSVVRVRTGLGGGGDCGYDFAAGAEYIIYAYAVPEGLTTNICTRTSEVARAADDVAFVSTLPALPLTPAEQPVPWLPVGVLLVALAGLLAVFVVVRQRRRAAPPG
jgi:hypothetical protein